MSSWFACNQLRPAQPDPNAHAHVTWNPYPRLPLGAVRDLLGVARALYRTALADEPRDVGRLEALEEIGTTLRAVLRAAHAHPGTNPHLDAWVAAERATQALVQLVGQSMQLGPVVAAMARRVSRPASMG
jgi:hypothetical protein